MAWCTRGAQIVRRAGWPEADIPCLAPSIAAPSGHPAIWTKLLSHLAHEAPSLAIDRLYADVPDQPLLVNTFAGVGFQPYCRQTVWRHFTPAQTAAPVAPVNTVRPRTAVDDGRPASTPRQCRSRCRRPKAPPANPARNHRYWENNRAENVTYIALDARDRSRRSS